jgi:hypothetical protein
MDHDDHPKTSVQISASRAPQDETYTYISVWRLPQDEFTRLFGENPKRVHVCLGAHVGISYMKYAASSDLVPTSSRHSHEGHTYHYVRFRRSSYSCTSVETSQQGKATEESAPDHSYVITSSY